VGLAEGVHEEYVLIPSSCLYAAARQPEVRNSTIAQLVRLKGVQCSNAADAWPSAPTRPTPDWAG